MALTGGEAVAYKQDVQGAKKGKMAICMLMVTRQHLIEKSLPWGSVISFIFLQQ